MKFAKKSRHRIASIENLEERQVLSAISPFSDTTAEVGKMQPSTEKLALTKPSYTYPTSTVPGRTC